MPPLHSLHPCNNPNHLCLDIDPEDACTYIECHTDYDEEEKESMKKILLEMRAQVKDGYDLKFKPLFKQYLWVSNVM